MDDETKQAFADLGAVLDRLDGKVYRLGWSLDRTRAEIMARIYRAQEQIVAQQGDANVLLDLLVTNQRIAERSLGDARTAVDLQITTSNALTKIQQEVQRLQARVDALESKTP